MEYHISRSVYQQYIGALGIEKVSNACLAVVGEGILLLSSSFELMRSMGMCEVT